VRIHQLVEPSAIDHGKSRDGLLAEAIADRILS
jgi:hypothetical protein